MRKKMCRGVIIGLIVSLMGLTVISSIEAGSKKLIAEKRDMFVDDTDKNMKDLYSEKEEREKEYRKKMLVHNREVILLLQEIRDILKKQNERQ